ncbi:MAG: glycerate kinase [Nocardioidaceae bacterium]|nr:glycerate kinase [Nocardioidaceae bacterium]
MVKVVVAPDKFRGSLTAREVCEAVERGVLRVFPDALVVSVPIADGGEGTVDAALAAGWRGVYLDSTGANGQPVHAAYAVDDQTALVELAQICGLDAIDEADRQPLTATTFGLGTVIAHALDQGVRRLVLALGGSASTDGGAGMLQALGVGLYDDQRHHLPPGGAALTALASVDLAGLHPRVHDVEVIVACDVDNSLLGRDGAAAIFGPQKGASPSDVDQLEAGLRRFSAMLEAAGIGPAGGLDQAGVPGAGAAGGTAYGAMAALRARLQPGIALVLDMVGFNAAVAGADLVVTGEGSIDAQTLRGKVPVGVRNAAGRHGVPVVAVAGRCSLAAADLAGVGFKAVYALLDIEPDPRRCMSEAGRLLEELAVQLTREQLSA